jgi:L-threonate 2-dehydrogenase
MRGMSKKTACVIGLGSMGMGAAQSLLRNGFDVAGADVSPERRAEFAKAGGRSFTSPAEAARHAEIVFVFVVNDKQTEDVLFGEFGAATVLEKGSVVACCATVPPAFAESNGARIEAMGLLAIDAPVSGGAAKAASGEMTIMGSGSDAAFAKAEPYFKAVAAKIYRLGDRPGMGSQVKTINQLLAGVHIAAACEAMALGISIGADPKVLYEVISNSAGASWMFQNRVPHILDGDYAPRSAVDIFVKDLGIVLDTGRSSKMPLPLSAAAHQLYLAASAKGLGREDDAALIKVYADQSGIKLPEK